MDNHYRQPESDVQRPGAFLTALLKIFDSTLNWLVGFLTLTEEEQRDAGIYLGRPGDE